MRLKTSHGTYVVASASGGLVHLPEPSDQDFQSVWNGASPPVPEPGSVEAAIIEGPLAPSTMMVLANGLVAFRRDGLYLCAEPAASELRFDRGQAGPWELFAIAAMDGTVVLQNVIGASIPGEPWIDLYPVPPAFRSDASDSVAAFLEKTSAKLISGEEEYIHVPVTISHRQLRLFQHQARTFFPSDFGKIEINKFCFNKEYSKYVIMTQGCYGIIFDQGGFFNNPTFLNFGSAPKSFSIKESSYQVNFSIMGEVKEENEIIFIIYDGNYENYYHWWVECLTKIEAYQSYFGRLPSITIWNGRPALRSWQLATLEILGVEVIHRATKNSEIIRVKEVIWIDWCSNYIPGFLLTGLRERILKKTESNNFQDQKIYIKRLFSRTISNESEFESMMLDNGYKIICAEDYSQIEQIHIFSSAKSVVAAHGAGLTNMLFMPQGSTVIELMPSAEVRTFFWLMAEKLRHKYGVLICNSVDGHFDSKMEVNLSDLNRLICMMDFHVGFEVGVESD